MFNNSEAYGRNELNNMISQVNVLPHNNNALNFNILGKQGRDSTQISSEQFNMQAYANFAQAAMGFEPSCSPYSQPQSELFNDRVSRSPKTMNPGLDFVAVDVPKFKDDELDDECEESVVQVKLEASSWADTDYKAPFCRDANGVQSYDKDDLKIVAGDRSVEEAKECIQNGSSSIVYFECPECSTLLQHPKRFLVHVKWHSFGLTHHKRMEEQREIQNMKEEKRKARQIQKCMIDQEMREAPDGEYPCKDCDKVFIAKNGLKKHRAKCHPVEMTECKVCLAPVKGLAGFRAHMATHTVRDQNSDTHRYHCPECPKKYKFSHSLYKHIDTHLEKTHKCEVCTKMFGSEAQLGRHMKSHEKIARGAQFHCAYCGKGYYDTFTLQIHERIHTNERPFTCDICQAAFQTNSSLKRHTKISHNSEAPHQCSTCQRTFNSEKMMQRHVMRAHSDPENFLYPCSMCDRRYFKPKDLRNHMYKTHATTKRASSRSETE